MTRAEFDKLHYSQIAIMIDEIDFEYKMNQISLTPDEKKAIEIVSSYYFAQTDKDRNETTPVIDRIYKLYSELSDELYALQNKEMTEKETTVLKSKFDIQLCKLNLIKSNCHEIFILPVDRHDVIVFCLRDSVKMLESIKKMKQKQLQKYKLHNHLDESSPIAQKTIKIIQRIEEKIEFAQNYT